MLVMLTELLSGLALFLFGMKFMSEGLQKAAGDKMRVILDRVTKNRFIAVIFGAIFTAIIQFKIRKPVHDYWIFRNSAQCTCHTVNS